MRILRRRIWLLPAAIVLGLALAACGNDDADVETLAGEDAMGQITSTADLQSGQSGLTGTEDLGDLATRIEEAVTSGDVHVDDVRLDGDVLVVETEITDQALADEVCQIAADLDVADVVTVVVRGADGADIAECS